MRILLKVFGYLIALVLLLLIGASVALTLFFDPNDYQDRIVAEVEKRTGRSLAIEGDIALSYYPWLGVQTGAMQLANAEGFGPEPFARVAEVDIAVRLLPLLERRIETGTITLRGLVLNLARDAAGRGNWEDLAAGEAAAPASDQPSSPAGGLGALVIGGIQIEDARVTWDDRQSGDHYVFTGVNLATDAVNLRDPFDLDFAMDVASRQPALDGHLTLNTRIHPDLQAQQYRLENARLQADLAGALPKPVQVTVTSDVQADLAEGTVRLDDLRASALGVEAEGQVRGTLDAPSFTGNLSVEPFNPRELLVQLGQPAPNTADPEALTRAAASLAFATAADAVKIQDLRVELDRSTVTGTAQRSGADRIGFNLALDAIDLDAYLPPPAEDAPPATPAETAVGAAAQAPLDTLRGLNLDGSLTIGELKVTNLRTRDVRMNVKADGGVIRIDPINARLYDGQYAGSAHLDARGDALQTRIQWNLSGIQAGPLLVDLAGQDRLLGTGSVEAQLSARGGDTDAIRRSLDGSLRIAFTDGAVQGINIAHMIRQAKARLQGQPPPPAEADRTDFSELSASFKIQDGVLRGDDLLAKSPLLRVNGEGRIDLPQATLDYLVTAVLVGTLKGQGGKELEDLKGVAIPIRLTGPLDDPKVALDLERLVKERATAEVQKQLEEKTEKLEQKLEEKLEETLGDKLDEGTREQLKERLPGALKGLFGR